MTRQHLPQRISVRSAHIHNSHQLHNVISTHRRSASQTSQQHLEHALLESLRLEPHAQEVGLGCEKDVQLAYVSVVVDVLGEDLESLGAVMREGRESGRRGGGPGLSDGLEVGGVLLEKLLVDVKDLLRFAGADADFDDRRRVIGLHDWKSDTQVLSSLLLLLPLSSGLGLSTDNLRVQLVT